MAKIIMKRYGGKVYLSRWIISHFPNHDIYVEPFAGSSAVLFSKEPSPNEVINDIDGELMQAYRIVKQNPYELAAMIWATPYASHNWREHQFEISDIEKAALQIAKTQQFYAGATGTSTFSVDAGHANKSKSKVWADWFQRILPAFLRLKDVQILSEDAIKTIKRFEDRSDCLYYVDPPYNGHEKEYKDGVDYGALAEALKAVKGKVIVSGYPDCAIFFQDWRQVEKDHTVRALTGRHKQKALKKKEMLFMNFTPPTPKGEK